MYFYCRLLISCAGFFFAKRSTDIRFTVGLQLCNATVKGRAESRNQLGKSEATASRVYIKICFISILPAYINTPFKKFIIFGRVKKVVHTKMENPFESFEIWKICWNNFFNSAVWKDFRKARKRPYQHEQIMRNIWKW